jgi:uncharacterized protein with von Willebrand factor type A (vWA) domain
MEMLVNAEETNRLASNIVEFCRFARAKGFNAGVAETMDALSSVAAVGVVERSVLKSAMRAVLCSSLEEWDRFVDVFEEFWSRDRRRLFDEPGAAAAAQRDTRLDESRNVEHVTIAFEEAVESTPAQEGNSVSGASALELMRKTDFSSVPQTDLHELERLAERLLDQMCKRLARKMRAQQRGRVDLSRTIRASIESGGDPINLRFIGRRNQEARLVILIDVSGSMDLYSLFLLRFAFALHRHFRSARTFIFSTGPVEVTTALNSRRLGKAFEALGRMPAGWSGGTRIGETIGELNRTGEARLLSRQTLFIIFSDGLDTGDPEKLGAEMRTIKRRVRKIIWLNPLAGMDNYRPLARGMSAALPYIDCFAAANNLDSLLRLERALGSGALR